MKELLEYVCKSIVNDPEAVSVEEKESQDLEVREKSNLISFLIFTLLNKESVLKYDIISS